MEEKTNVLTRTRNLIVVSRFVRCFLRINRKIEKEKFLSVENVGLINQW